MDFSDYQRFDLSTSKQRPDRLFLDLEFILGGTKIKGPFLLDLGNGGSLNMTSHTVHKYKLAEKINTSVKYYSDWGGVGGASSSEYFRAESVNIGGFEIKEPILSYSHDKAGALAAKDYLGLLGNGIFEHFDMIIDFPNQRLYLKPNNQFEKPDKLARPGFAYVDRTDITDGFVVRALFENQQAEQAGLRLSDIITHIDDNPVKNLSKQDLEKIWGKESRTSKVTLTIERGIETIRLDLPLKDIEI